ncbi:acyltransferase [soil metagenome]
MTEATAGELPEHRRVLYLDGWRGLAILAVIVAHYGTTKGLNLGRFGVEMFFVLSGRLMAEILFVRATDLPTFFVRRISRVWPALFVFVTVCLVASLAFGIGDVGWAHWLAAVTFTTNYQYLFGINSGWLNHTWSLCVEEHTYLLLGLLAFVHRRRPLPIIAVLAGIAFAMMLNGLIQTLAGLDYYQVYWRSDVRAASILMGAAAYLLLRDRPCPPWVPLVFGLVAVILNYNAVPDPVKYTIGSACLAVCIVLMPRTYRGVLGFLSSRPALFIGAISYSLYLWQQPFWKIRIGSGVFGLVCHLSLLAVAVSAAYLSYRLVEGPARAGVNRLWHQFSVRHRSAA